MPAPRISVVIPAYNAAVHLDRCLESLEQSTLVPLECIVVDDGSSDDTAEVATRRRVRLVRLATQRGPAYARNRGVGCAAGEIIVFLDADVTVQRGTVERIARAFEQDANLDALMGSYDDEPAEPSFLSQYRNLLHCYTHQRAREQASTFWCGCGAIRRDVYLAHGGLDESYTRPSIEDIELGYRLYRAGRRIQIDPTIQVKHHKRWTLGGMLRTDMFSRGIPWTRLILRDRRMPDELSLEWGQRTSVALAGLLVLIVLGLFAWRKFHLVLAFVGVIGVILFLNRRFYQFLALRRGWSFAARAIPAHVGYLLYSGLAFAAGAVTYVFARKP